MEHHHLWKLVRWNIKRFYQKYELQNISKQPRLVIEHSLPLWAHPSHHAGYTVLDIVTSYYHPATAITTHLEYRPPPHQILSGKYWSHQHNPVTVLLHHLPIALTRTNKEFYQIFQVSQDDATEDHALHLAYWVPTISEYLLSIILEESCEESCHTAFTYLAFLAISSLLSALYNEAFTYVRISSLSQHQDGLLYHLSRVSFGFKEKWF